MYSISITIGRSGSSRGAGAGSITTLLALLDSIGNSASFGAVETKSIAFLGYNVIDVVEKARGMVNLCSGQPPVHRMAGQVLIVIRGI
jgi:hypothetical protein